MAHKLDPHYNDFGGLDSRTNKLKADPKTARAGKNFQFNYQDEVQKANGWQKKMPAAGGEWGTFEYKYTDINTGQAISQYVGVDASGYLNRAIKHRLKLVKAGGTVDNYSLFYDDSGSATWKIVFYNAAGVSLGSFDFTTSTTLLQLETGITALAITGLTADIVDADGTTVGSTTCLAYTLDTVITEDINTGSNYNDTYYWERVPLPSGSEVPFPLVVSKASDEDFEGVTATNLNNALYLTDGSFPMRYDGYAVYRAGMPRIRFSNGFRGGISDDTGGGLTPNTNYKYAKQLCFVDPNGVEICGDLEPLGETYSLPGGQSAIYLTVPPVGNAGAPQSKLFPVFSCEVNGDQTITGTGSKSLTVHAGHNIKVGQCLRVPIMNTTNATATQKGMSWAYYEVTAVGATTITFNKTVSTHYMPLYVAGPPISTFTLSNAAGAGQDNLFKSKLVINAAYVPDDWVGEVTDPRNPYSDPGLNDSEITFAWHPTPVYGAFCRFYRSESNGETLYRLADAPLPHIETTSSFTSYLSPFYVLDRLADDDVVSEYEGGLSEIPIDETSGEELPRACRYLSNWQQQLVQGGRPYDAASIIGTAYPVFDVGLNATAKWTTDLVNPPWYYSEADLCDFQSFYWAAPGAIEGFPRDGLHEFRIDTNKNDEIRGLAPNKDSFFALKQRSVGLVTGDLALNNLSLEILESSAGCACHKSIATVRGTTFFMDDTNGFWSVVPGRLPEFVGFRIQDEFKQNSRGLNFRKAWAADFEEKEKYVCFIPGDSSVFFVFDYAPSGPDNRPRGSWYPWDGVDGTGGVMATADGQLWVSNQSSAGIWKQKYTGTKYDFSVHESAVDFQYTSAWINYAKAIIKKHFSKLWINSIQGGFSLIVSQYNNYLDTAVGEYTVSFLAESASKKDIKEYVNLNKDGISAISVKFANNTLYEDVRLQGWEIEFAPEYDLEEGRP